MRGGQLDPVSVRSVWRAAGAGSLALVGSSAATRTAANVLLPDRDDSPVASRGLQGGSAEGDQRPRRRDRLRRRHRRAVPRASSGRAARPPCRRPRRAAGLLLLGGLRRQQPPRRLRPALRQAGTDVSVSLAERPYDRAEDAERAAFSRQSRPSATRSTTAARWRRHAAVAGHRRAVRWTPDGKATSCRPCRVTWTDACSINGDGVVSGWSRRLPNHDGEDNPVLWTRSGRRRAR